MPRKKKMPGLALDDLNEIRRIARGALGNNGINHADVKDIEQELALHLMRKIPVFRKGKNCAWQIFRGVVLRQRLLEIFRERSRPSAKTSSPYLLMSLDEELQSGALGSQEEILTLKDCLNQDGVPADGTESLEIPGLEMQIDMQIFISGLPLKLRRVCVELQTQGISSAAKSLRLHRSDIYRRIGKIRTLMVEAGLDIYL